jgi:hypothetical protein
MSHAPERPKKPSPEVVKRARALVNQALGSIWNIEGERIQVYLRAGRAFFEAKEAVGHGHWIDFVLIHFPRSYKRINRIMLVADAAASDAWLAARLKDPPEGWTFETAVEYAHASPAVRLDLRENGAVHNSAGDRVPLDKATRETLRHHKRFITGKTPRPDPIVAALAKSHFLSPMLAGGRLRQIAAEIDELFDHVNLAAEDLGDDAAMTPLAEAQYVLRQRIEHHEVAVQAARVAMKARLGRL